VGVQPTRVVIKSAHGSACETSLEYVQVDRHACTPTRRAKALDVPSNRAAEKDKALAGRRMSSYTTRHLIHGKRSRYSLHDFGGGRQMSAVTYGALSQRGLPRVICLPWQEIVIGINTARGAMVPAQRTNTKAACAWLRAVSLQPSTLRKKKIARHRRPRRSDGDGHGPPKDDSRSGRGSRTQVRKTRIADADESAPGSRHVISSRGSGTSTAWSLTMTAGSLPDI